jgi:hypothetical protein
MLGNSSLSQAVFETSNQYWSPTDLQDFQEYYGLTVQTAEDVGGYYTTSSTGSCSTSGGSPDCNEGNLDLQYIMGVAQNVATIYWYVGGGNPFVTWLTDIADESGRTVAQIGIDMNILTFHNSCYQIPLKSIQYHGALSSR